MKKKGEKSSIKIIAVVALLVATFSVTLYGSLMSVGADNGGIKTSRNMQGGLVSAGAPRSQLALKQMFDSMSLVRTNGNRTIYEPITEEYLKAVADKIENGEKPRLSVEEILYIISDSITLGARYDAVKLHGEGNVILKKSSSDKPMHIATLEQRQSVYDIILYRIRSLCHESAFEIDGDTVVYYPDEAGERNRSRYFVFTSVSDSARTDNIVYCPGDGQRISLFPSDNTEAVDLKYMTATNEPLSEVERGILESEGYNPDRCRNITPACWNGITECKAVIISGRIVIVDPERGVAVDSAPSDMRTVSIAAGDSDGDGIYELYFTGYSDEGCAAIKYFSGNIEILAETEFCIGAYEDIDGKGVSFYRVDQIESGEYLNLLRRSGDKILFQEEITK